MARAIEAVGYDLTGAAREARFFHANHGRFGDVLRGFRGQGEVVRALLTREIMATRLHPSNTGLPLRELASSEYFATLADEPQYAFGEAFFFRIFDNASPVTTGNFLPGVIPSGTTVTRPQQTGEYPMAEAKYATTADAVAGTDDTENVQDLGGGTYRHTQFVSAPIVASRPGLDANTPMGTSCEIGGRLFDSGQPAANRFQGGGLTSAGGFSSVSDDQIRALAKAMARGRSGANNGAAIAGTLSDPRVRRVAASLDYTNAILRLYVADASWATSAAFRSAIKQSLSDNKWLGFGARVAMGEIYNQPITAMATLVLRKPEYQDQRTEIDAAALAALTRYFDERPDFYTWRTTAVGAVLAAADPRILTCVSPVVLSEGSPAVQPSSKIAQGGGLLPHFSLRGLRLAYANPVEV